MTDLRATAGVGARSDAELIWRPLIPATISRLSLSMVPLGILVLVDARRGSYGLAGWVAAAYAVGLTVGAPAWGRLMDQWGQRWVLRATALAQAFLLVLLALGTASGTSGKALIALAFVAGAASTPISPALRASWGERLDRRQLGVALAYDATLVELTFVAGPLILSGLLILMPGSGPLIVAAALPLIGTLVYTSTYAAKAVPPVRVREHVAMGRRPSNPKSLVVLAVMGLISCAFGALDTSMAGTASRLLGGADHIGLPFAAIALGSVISGLVVGTAAARVGDPLEDPQPWYLTRTALLVLFAAMAGVYSSLLRAHLTAWPFLALALFGTGLTIAPILIRQQATLNQAVKHRRHQAQALMAAANLSGIAGGTALAGVLIDRLGPWAAAAAAVVLAAIAATVCGVAALCEQGTGRIVAWRSLVSMKS